jgi:hypothetical protein
MILSSSNLNAQNVFNKKHQNPIDSAMAKIVYNIPPDTIKINGELIFVESGSILKFKPGIYTLEAIKECYEPIKQKVTLIPFREKQINLELKRFNSTEKLIYDISLYSNIITLPIINTLMIANKNNSDYVLPVALSSLAVGYWHWKFNDKFDACSGKLVQNSSNNNDFSIYFGISTQNVNYVNPAKQKVSYERTGTWNTFTQNFILDFDLALSSSSFIPNITLFAEIRKYFLSPKLFGEIYLQSIFGSKIKYHVKEYYPEDDWREGYARDYKAEIVRKYPLIAEASLNYEFLSIIDQTFILSIGGYWGNPFIPKDKFAAPVQQLYLPPQVYENPEEIKYSQSAYGLKLGLIWETPLSKSFIHNFGFKWYNTASREFLTITSSFKYNIL